MCSDSACETRVRQVGVRLHEASTVSAALGQAVAGALTLRSVRRASTLAAQSQPVGFTSFESSVVRFPRVAAQRVPSFKEGALTAAPSVRWPRVRRHARRGRPAGRRHCRSEPVRILRVPSVWAPASRRGRVRQQTWAAPTRQLVAPAPQMSDPSLEAAMSPRVCSDAVR